LQVSWIRKRDLHILTFGQTTYTNDGRFSVIKSATGDLWTLRIRSVQMRDAGLYECQVSSEPKISKAVRLKVVGQLNPLLLLCYLCILFYFFQILSALLLLYSFYIYYATGDEGNIKKILSKGKKKHIVIDKANDLLSHPSDRPSFESCCSKKFKCLCSFSPGRVEAEASISYGNVMDAKCSMR
jgi:hypothetical protein